MSAGAAGLTLIEAAAVPETYFTVWTNVFDRGRLAAGEWLLVHGGTSGIGTTAIQLAAARGAKVLATAGSSDKCRACERLGAVRAIDYRADDFVAAVHAATDGRGVDVVLDIIGGDYTPRNLECLARDGRLVQIGVMGGETTTVSLRRILMNRLTITGSTLRIRTPREKGAIAAALERESLAARGLRGRPAHHRWCVPAGRCPRRASPAREWCCRRQGCPRNALTALRTGRVPSVQLELLRVEPCAI